MEKGGGSRPFFLCRSCLEQVAILCRYPSFLRKQESSPPAPPASPSILLIKGEARQRRGIEGSGLRNAYRI